VPECGFAITLLTDSTDGPKLIDEPFFTNWAIRQFAGLSDPPAQLAPYAGLYRGLDRLALRTADDFVDSAIEIIAADGGLRATSEDQEFAFAFYRYEKESRCGVYLKPSSALSSSESVSRCSDCSPVLARPPARR
jgi:hypothetical protein